MSSIRFVCCSDTHLGFDYPLTKKAQLPRRGEDFFNNFKHTLNYALENRADFLVHCGDLFFRSKLPAKIVHYVYDILYQYAANGLKILLVPGNHERANLPAHLFLNHPNLFIFDRPATVTFIIDNLKIAIAGFPYQYGNIRDNFKLLLQQTGLIEENADYKIICLHQAIDGATVGPGDYTFFNKPDIINPDDIPQNISLVCCGHIHRRQIQWKNKIPIIFPGSTERTSFVEMNEKKGFFDIHIANNIKSFFIELPVRNMIDIKVPTLSEELYIDFMKDQAAKLIEDAIVRVLPADKSVSLDRSLLSVKKLRSLLGEDKIIKISRYLYDL